MDTKSRNIRYSGWIKLLAVLLSLAGPLVMSLAYWLISGRSGISIVAPLGILFFAGGIAAFLAGVAWLIYAAGRRPGDEGVRLLPIDNIYLDVGLVASVIIITFCILGLTYLWNMFYYNGSYPASLAVGTLGALLELCLSATAVTYLTSFARRLKRKEIVSHSLTGKTMTWLYRMLRGALKAGPPALRAAAFFCGYAAASSLMLLAFIELAEHYYGPVVVKLFGFLLYAAVNAAALAYLLHKVTAINAIQAGIAKIRSGELGYQIPETGGEPCAELAQGINGIAEGLSAAVESEVKAERMKAELITNVSHDLRTPLTSIITYVDLLKSEGTASPNAAGYVDVLEQKARRLKALTDDLFEAAKAASGSLQPSIARLDVGELLSQGLGELSDRIGESGLDFRCSLPERRLCIEADGKLLWRVMENLLSNVFKYALPNSRVYVSAESKDGRAVITMKNISASELNIPAEELMERFTRGDAARSSEGSGLGLAIAKSLVELQGGKFRIGIDGDLFKACVEFPESACTDA